TGVVLRSGDILHSWALLTRDGPDLDFYLGEVIDTVTKTKERARELALTSGDLYAASPLLAVEDINDPNPHMGVASVRGLIDTAHVIGAISGHWPIVRVPPGKHGSRPLTLYPEKLIGSKERTGRG